MDEIEDPWHSRPIDVHRWSDHPEVVQFVDRVWDSGGLPQDVVGKPGPKPKMAFKKQLRVLILDLYVSASVILTVGHCGHWKSQRILFV
jgi:hypothetical protein